MFKRVASSVVVALVVLTGWAARAQPLADRVPGDALIYVGWGGGDKVGPGFEGSHLQAGLAEAKMSEVIDQALPRMPRRSAAVDPGAAQPLAMTRSLMGAMWRHPSAFYFGGIE